MNLVFQKPPGCPQRRNIEQNCAGRPPVPFVTLRSCPHGFPLPMEASEAPHHSHQNEGACGSQGSADVEMGTATSWGALTTFPPSPTPSSFCVKSLLTPSTVGGGSYRESAKTPSCPPAQCCPGPGDSAEPPPAAADPAVAPGLATCTLGSAVPQDGRAERQPWAEAWDRVASPPPYL